ALTRTLPSVLLPPLPVGAAGGWPKPVWKLKPAPLGVRACGFSLKPASIAWSIAPTMACPDVWAIVGASESWILCHLVLSVATVTVWISAAEVLAALLGSPLYCAVSEWLPTASEEIEKLAVPAASVPVPTWVPPSNKLTDPVGESPVTFTANCTGCPKLDGFCNDDSAVVVPTCPLGNR